jgi:hypothetical protein
MGTGKNVPIYLSPFILQNDQSGVVSFILDWKRLVGPLVYDFASSWNREAVGPTLELKLRHRCGKSAESKNGG